MVSGTEVKHAYGMAAYQQLLLDHAFGNYRDLLYDVTLNPAMGRYLDMANNDKPDTMKGTTPNENFARELLQLFSIGVYDLNPDSMQMLDANGKPIASYDEDTIEGFAHVFTGWTYAPRPGEVMKKHNPLNYEGAMVVRADNHDGGEKKLLRGITLAPGQTPEKDLNDAIENVFRHPNVGPFIGKQLIQHLVTANPTPSYVARVTAAFNDNGKGIRGDLMHVIRAILTDVEARGDLKTEAAYGHLREPALFIISLLRGLRGASDGVFPRAQSAAMDQPIFMAPSVFNFYPPDYILPGDTILSPVSAILNSSSALDRANFVNALVFAKDGIAPDASVGDASGTRIDLADLVVLARDPDQLIDELDGRLLNRTISATARSAVVHAVESITASDALNRVRTAVYLVALNLAYQVSQ